MTHRVQYFSMLTSLFHKEPGDVVLGKIGVAAVDESVVYQVKIGMPIDDLTTEIALEQTIAVATVRNLHRTRIVVLANEQIAARRPMKRRVDLLQVFWVHVNQ